MCLLSLTLPKTRKLKNLNLTLFPNKIIFVSKVDICLKLCDIFCILHCKLK